MEDRQAYINEAISRINFATGLRSEPFARDQVAGAARNLQEVICRFHRITDDSLVKD